MKVKEALAQIMATQGCIACCVVDSNSGMVLGFDSNGRVNIELAAAGNTEVLRQKRKTMKALGLQDSIEDILVTMGTQYHVFRPLTANESLFVYVVLDKAKANLAMARYTVGVIEKQLEI